MGEELPPEFRETVDRFCAIVDRFFDTAGDRDLAQVAAVVLDAAARYNARGLLALKTDAAREYQEAAVDYLARQFRAALERHIDRLRRTPGPAA